MGYSRDHSPGSKTIFFLSDNVNDHSSYDDSALLAVSSVVMTRGTINHTTINDAFWHFGDKKNGTNLHF